MIRFPNKKDYLTLLAAFERREEHGVPLQRRHHTHQQLFSVVRPGQYEVLRWPIQQQVFSSAGLKLDGVAHG